MASRSSGGKGKGKAAHGAKTVSRWKPRTHFNFAVGRSTLRTLPVVIHLLSDDIDWFSEDPSLFDELKHLLRDRVVAAFAGGDKDPEEPKTRKRAKKEEVCVQGDRLQFTYRYRKTNPRYTVLLYPEDVEIETRAGDSSKSTTSSAGAARGKGSASAGPEAGAEDSSRSTKSSAGAVGGKGSARGDPETGAGSSSKSTAKSAGADDGKDSASDGPKFRHLPLSQSTLLVWVYRFDIDDPYRPVPNSAALQFAPPAKPSVDEAIDFEAVGKSSRSGAGVTGVQPGSRDAGLLSWLWGPDEGDEVSGGGVSSRGRVRQHFVGSAAWQGGPGLARERRGRDEKEEEDDDIQRAIALSLAAGGATGEGGKAGEQDLVEVLDDEGDF